jgi:hypothetical protein
MGEIEKTNFMRLTVLKGYAASSHEVIEEYNNNLLPCVEDNACRGRKPQYAWNSPHLLLLYSIHSAASCTPPCPEPRRYATGRRVYYFSD